MNLKTATKIVSAILHDAATLDGHSEARADCALVVAEEAIKHYLARAGNHMSLATYKALEALQIRCTVVAIYGSIHDRHHANIANPAYGISLTAARADMTRAYGAKLAA